MRRGWAPEAINLQQTTRSLLADHGGVELARAAEREPATRVERVRPALESIGLLDLDPQGDEVESSAAMLSVQACGEVVAPYPVTRVLGVPVDRRGDVDAVYLVDGVVDHLEHADLFERVVAVDVRDGHVDMLAAGAAVTPAPLDPFGVAVGVSDERGRVSIPEPSAQMAHVLDAFWMSGALESTTNDAARYATTREQFGKAIGTFGEIRGRLAEMSVAVDGLQELAAYTWFLVHRGRATPSDVWALRLGMLEAAESVLRHGHQVFGAIGLCEETDLTVVDRHVSGLRLRPCGYARTTSLLVQAVDQFGFDGTFDVDPTRP